MTVTERITVKVEGYKIKRGIYRDFPTKRKDKTGKEYRTGFEIVEVLRDGKVESYHTELLSDGIKTNGVRIYFGKEDVFLNEGVYTYTLVYKTNRQLNFLEDYDELYWNVTGDGWSFPIKLAKARVFLPKSINIESLEVNAFTGPRGSFAGNFAKEEDDSLDDGVKLYTTKTLLPKEGFSILIQFPKDHVVSELSDLQKALYFIGDNADIIGTAISFLLVLLYFTISWFMYGKDPSPGTIIPLYEPPRGFSPSALSYISCMGFNQKAFIATILDLAVKGFITISESNSGWFYKKDYVLHKTNRDQSTLLPREKEIMEILLGPGIYSIELEKENYSQIQKAISSLQMSLFNDYYKKYFKNNIPTLVIGVLIAVFGLGMTYVFAFKITYVGELVYFFTGCVATIFSFFLFVYLMQVPTALGRKLMDQISGFKMYLEIGERESLKLINCPEKTPQHFEEYLPYAFALGVENEWTEKFESVLQRAAAMGHYKYKSTWYHGSAVGGLFSLSSIDSFSSSFSGAISSSSSKGGSGGGSGGGGGGGW